MITLDDIWMRLTTEDIGFFTYRRKAKIPTLPGVYAWFFPLRLKQHPEELLSFSRKLSSYDAGCRGIAAWETKEAGFRWDPLTVRVGRNSEYSKGLMGEDKWNKISTGGQDVQNGFKQALFVSTIFSRPLYVGLSKNLSSRYNDHILGQGQRNTFHSRFENYMNSIRAELTIKQLLFVCIPIKDELNEVKSMSLDQISVLEEMLKVICQPVFDDR